MFTQYNLGKHPNKGIKRSAGMKKYLDREALKASKKYSGDVAIPTIGLAISIILLYLAILFLFANGLGERGGG